MSGVGDSVLDASARGRLGRQKESKQATKVSSYVKGMLDLPATAIPLLRL